MSVAGPIQHNAFAQALLSLQNKHDSSQSCLQNSHVEECSLPAVPLEHGAWVHFQRGSAFQACRQDLLRVTAHAKKFIEVNVPSGKSRQRALEGLRQFEDTKINASGTRLAPLTFGLNRVNLKQLCKLLENNQIPLTERTTVAAELFSSLGVCAEGEAIRIQDALVTLQSHSQGIAAKVLTAKNHLIEQHLLSLVQHESGDTEFDKSMEIHHAQGLKNSLAEKWGLIAREDRNIDLHFQEGLATVADALITQTITPTAIASHIADALSQTLEQNLPHGVMTWHSYDNNLIEKISNVLQTEFGNQISLHDVLEVTDDYSQFKVKSTWELKEVVLNAMGNLDLPVNLPTKNEPTEDIGTLINSLGHLKNTKALQSRLYPKQSFRLSVGNPVFQQFMKNNTTSNTDPDSY